MNCSGSQRSRHVASPQNSYTMNGVSPKSTSNCSITCDSRKHIASPQNSFTMNGVSPKNTSNGSTTCDSRTPLSSVNHQACEQSN